VKRLSLLFIACSCLVAVATAEDTWAVREDGVGPVKIGMTLAQLNAVLHEKLMKDPQDDQACFYVNPKGHPHVSFMIENGKVARIDVQNPGISTSSGIRVGDSEARAKQAYGAKLKIDPHKYIDDGHYLTVRSSDGHFGIRFETEKGKITTFYAGAHEAIQYVEGCE